jgi:antitoxin (DNA-binding transcriptional repressor) of toxin-antitoxin stability system
MKVVGIRQLKNRLSQYLRMACPGEEIVMTDRGEAITALREVDSSKSATQLAPSLTAPVRQGQERRRWI